MFTLNDDERVITETAAAFAAKRLAPHTLEWDASKHFPTDVLRAHVPESLVLEDWMRPKPARVLPPEPGAVARAAEAIWSAKKPLVEVNCAAIPSELIESELFGHMKCSFTGATSDRAGKRTDPSSAVNGCTSSAIRVRTSC